MELRHLRYFVAVAEAENVSRAALKLHISQPGLSRQMQDLEEEIGFPLFERQARSLHLTEAGKALLPQARAVLQRADEAVAAARKVATELETEIQLGYAPSLTVYLLPQALRIFQAKFPKIRVRLHDLSSEEMLAHLRADKLDLALMALPSGRAARGLEVQEMARYPLRVVVAPKHRFAKAKTLTLAQVAAEPLIAYTRADYPDYHETLDQLFRTVAVRPRIAEEHDGVNGLIAAVESGGGIALAPSLLSCMVGTRLRLIPITEKTHDVIIAAAWKRGARRKAAEDFVAAAAAVPPLGTPTR